MEAEPNIQCAGAKIVPITLNSEFGVFSEAANDIPQFIEFTFQDGNVLHIYADGSYSDYGHFRFVASCYSSNFGARCWLFEQFFQENFPSLWKWFSVARWFKNKKRQAYIWYLNKRAKDSVTYH